MVLHSIEGNREEKVALEDQAWDPQPGNSGGT